MPYKPSDYYARKAKAEDYRARSVYKLQEIQQRFAILAAGYRVLDLGASPGSWSQYASQIVGPKGHILGIDLTPIDLKLNNGTFLVGDLNEAGWPQRLNESAAPPPYDVVLSDMAPKTTGVRSTDMARSVQLCEQAFWIAQQVLRSGGHFVCKMFDNAESNAFRQMLRQHFEEVHIVRPKSTRQVSTEIFFVARRHRQPIGGQ